MKRFLASLFLVVAISLRADFTAELADDNHFAAPYTGMLFAPHGQGSGTVVGHANVVTTAAHVVYMEESMSWAAELTWRRSTYETEVPVRSLRYFSSYSDLVSREGINHPKTFAKDFAAGISFEELSIAESGALPPRVSDASSVLTGSHAKQLVGFPSGTGHYMELQFAGPFTMPFRREAEDYYLVEGVALGSGGSGGGIWAEVDGVMHWLGVYVSGREGSDFVAASSGVVACTPSSWALVKDLMDGNPMVAPRILSAPHEVVSEIGEKGVIEVEFSLGFPKPEIIWRRKDREGVVDEDVRFSSNLASFDETGIGKTSVSISSLENNEAEFQAEIFNAAGSARSDWIPFRFREAEPPSFISYQESLHLNAGERGVLEVTTGGVPAPTIYWEYLDAAAHSAVRLWSSSSDGYTVSGNRLEIDADCRAFANVRVRARAKNALGEAIGEWFLVSSAREALPVTAAYTELPKAVIPEDEAFVVDLDLGNDDQVLWEYRLPGVTDWEDANNAQWALAYSYETKLRLQNERWNPIHGYEIRAVVRRRWQELGRGYQYADHPLQPIALVAEGIPVITDFTGYWDGEYAFRYRAYRPRVVEWQVFDERSGAWRPAEVAGAYQNFDDNFASIRLPKGSWGWRTRAVLRQPGLDAYVAPDRETAECPHPDMDEAATGTFFLGLLAEKTAAWDNRLVLKTMGPVDGSPKLWTFHVEDGELNQAGDPLTAPPGTVGFVESFDVCGEYLVATCWGGGGLDGSAAGVALVYDWDAENKGWRDPRYLHAPNSGAGSRITRAAFVGNWLHVVTAEDAPWVETSHLYRQTNDGFWEWAATLERPPSVSSEDWFTQNHTLQVSDDLLFLSGRNALNKAFLAVWQREGPDGSLRFIRNDAAKSPIVAVDREDHWAHFYSWGEAQYFGRSGWSEAEGFIDRGSVSLGKSWKDLDQHGRTVIGRYGTPQTGPGAPHISPGKLTVAVFDITAEGTITDPISIKAYPGRINDYDAFGVMCALSSRYAFVLSRTRSQAIEISAFPLEFLNTGIPPIFSPWAEGEWIPETREVELRFRTPKDGHLEADLMESADLGIWQESLLESILLESNVDGDGKTELRAVRLPAGNGQRFYRIKERANTD